MRTEGQPEQRQHGKKEQVDDGLSPEGVVERKGADEGAGQRMGLAGNVQMSLSRFHGQHALKKGELQRVVVWRICVFLYRCINLHSFGDKEVIPRVRENWGRHWNNLHSELSFLDLESLIGTVVLFPP